jgi:hypothetical protein
MNPSKTHLVQEVEDLVPLGGVAVKRGLGKVIGEVTQGLAGHVALQVPRGVETQLSRDCPRKKQRGRTGRKSN